MSSVRTVTLGFSSCPNDTFMFHHLLDDPPEGLAFEVAMEDIEALNERALAGGDRALEVTKLSVAALGRVLHRYRPLDSGAALGRGCGPLVVARGDGAVRTLDGIAGARVAVPGLGTTAYALLRMFAGDFTPVPMRFDRIMPAVAAGEVSAGLVIHESRFTYPDHGLIALADLGVHWESATGLPLPLGVIAVRRDVPVEHAHAFEAGLARSVRQAWREPTASQAFVRRHAQEMDPGVCRQHIELYVNEYSASMGAQGRAAVEGFLMRGREVGILPSGPAAFDGS